MQWVADLASLPAVIAVLVVFAFCLVVVVKYISKHMIEPLKGVITNHMDHLMEEQREDRSERCKMREALERQTEAITEQRHSFEKLCDKVAKG